MGRVTNIFWLSVILHKSSEIGTLIIYTFERRKLRLREVNLIPKVFQLLSGLSSSLGKFDSRAGVFHYSNMLPSGFRLIRYIYLSISKPVLEGGLTDVRLIPFAVRLNN